MKQKVSKGLKAIIPFLFLTSSVVFAHPDHTEALELLEQSKQKTGLYLKEAETLHQQSLNLLKKPLGICKGAVANSKKTDRGVALHAEKSIHPNHALSILVSSSMPAQSLKSLYQEAEATGAILVLRGLKNNSFKETAAMIKTLGIGLQINPLLFKEHQVKVVPTFLFVDEKQQGHTLNGNVSLAYAIEKFKDLVP